LPLRLLVTSLSLSPPAVSEVIHPSNLESSIHRFFHWFHRRTLLLHPPVSSSIPYVLKREIAFPIRRLRRSKSSPQILSIRFIEPISSSYFSNHPIGPPIRSMHSPLIFLVARRSISSESFSPCRPQTIIDVQDIRPQDSTPVSQPFFFQALSLDWSLITLPQKIQVYPNRHFFLPILALLWNPGKNWLVQRQDAIV
jgi:hypothetical protein